MYTYLIKLIEWDEEIILMHQKKFTNSELQAQIIDIASNTKDPVRGPIKYVGSGMDIRFRSIMGLVVERLKELYGFVEPVFDATFAVNGNETLSHQLKQAV